MEIRLRYFAAAREALGRSEERRRVPDGATAGEVLDRLAADEPRLAPLRPALLLMVNREYVEPGHRLAEGDELALIPPVSGGADAPAPRFLVTAEPLDARPVEALVATPAAGALVAFTGTVRDNARGRAVVALEYEAYAPAAEGQMARIAAEIGERWTVAGVAIHHRVGTLRPGEASVVVAVAAAHRGEALAAVSYAIERLKQIVPIWKKEHYADGAVWIGSEADYRRELAEAAHDPPGSPGEDELD